MTDPSSPCITCKTMQKRVCRLQKVCRRVKQHKEKLVNTGVLEHRSKTYERWYRTHER